MKIAAWKKIIDQNDIERQDIQMKYKKLLIGLIVLVILVLSAVLLNGDSWDVIDLRKSMPKGNFLEASIVQLGDDGNVNYVWLKEISTEKISMQEFQTQFEQCVEEARKDAEEARKKAKEAGEKPLLKLPYDPIGGITKLYRLGIVTDMGKYAFYLAWTDDYVRFDGLMSKDFRKVLSDVGFKGAE